jgi:hypothetical protein
MDPKVIYPLKWFGLVHTEAHTNNFEESHYSEEDEIILTNLNSIIKSLVSDSKDMMGVYLVGSRLLNDSERVVAFDDMGRVSYY